MEAAVPQEAGKMKLINCPKCNLPMKKLTKQKVTIDICKKCEGMWLDKGEMEKLLKMEPEKKTWWKFW